MPRGPRLPRALLLVCALATTLAPGACGCGRGASDPRSNDPVLLVRCDVADAALWVDDRFVAPVSAMPGGVRLRPGAHRVEVRHEGHHTRYFELALRAGERRTLEVTLPEALP